jgi:hypothetical protein
MLLITRGRRGVSDLLQLAEEGPENARAGEHHDGAEDPHSGRVAHHVACHALKNLMLCARARTHAHTHGCAHVNPGYCDAEEPGGVAHQVKIAILRSRS